MDREIFKNDLLAVGEYTVDGLGFTHFYVDIAGTLEMVQRFVKTYGGNIEVKYGKLTYRMLRKDFALMIKVADLSEEKLKELALRFPEEVKFEKETEITL
jgi:hypothetical protein